MKKLLLSFFIFSIIVIDIKAQDIALTPIQAHHKLSLVSKDFVPASAKNAVISLMLNNNTKIEVNCPYKNNVLHGKFKQKLPYGFVKGGFKNGMKEGTWLLKVEGKKEQLLTYKNDSLHGKFILYKRNMGTSFVYEKIKGSYEVGEKSGTWIKYREGRKSEVQMYENGLPNGKYIKYDTNYRNYILFEGSFKDGLKHGEWTEWYGKYYVDNSNSVQGEDIVFIYIPRRKALVSIYKNGKEVSYTSWSPEGKLEISKQLVK